MLIAPPLSLYVHLPWCVHKCPYCDFNSYALKTTLQESGYVAALLRDLDQDLPRVVGRQVETVFFGGGTPSLFRPEAIGRILEGIRQRLSLTPHAEITLEANPGTVERGRFTEYRAAGVTRLSIGVQSFDDQRLHELGRIHDASDARRAAAEAHAAGLDNFNLDLMYGLPHQTPSGANADIEQAMELAPAHISHYQLTLEPNTVFYAKPPPLPDDDLIWNMQQSCQSLLQQAGYVQYEISAYAQVGRQCRHNLNYWRYGDYLGIGAGAHAKLTDTEHGRILRFWKTKHPTVYLRTAGTPDGVSRIKEVSDSDRAFEFMLNRLRLLEGFSPKHFNASTGLSIDTILPVLHQCTRDGLMEMTDGQWRTSMKGFTFLNEVLVRFLPNDPDSEATSGSHRLAKLSLGETGLRPGRSP